MFKVHHKMYTYIHFLFLKKPAKHLPAHGWLKTLETECSYNEHKPGIFLCKNIFRHLLRLK